MDHFLISLSNDEVKNGQVEDTFERRLKRCLNDQAKIIGLYLRVEQHASSELLDWLEKWTRELRGAGKQLVVIPADSNQFEALELSHPEQYLSYYSSVEEWEAAYSARQSEEKALEQPHPASFQEPLRAAQQEPPPSSFPQVENVQIAEAQLLEQVVPVPPGAVVEISGEYACLGCGIQRTWLKGDCMEACDNIECLNPKAGWKLVCDLF